MNVKIKTICFVIGVDCAGQPITVFHYLEIVEEKGGNANFDIQRVKVLQKLRRHIKRAKGKRHCGQSQKDIRVKHK